MIALDLDGTLIDCRPRQILLLEKLLQRLPSNTIDLGAIWNSKRSGLTTAAALHHQGMSISSTEEIVRQWRDQIEEDEWLALDMPFSGVPEILAELRSIHPIFLLTARRRADAVGKLLRDFGLQDFFSDVCVVDPANAVAQKAAVLAARQPLLYCGDSEIDARAAELAVAPFVGVTWGQRSREILSRFPNIAIVEKMDALPRIASSL